MPNMKRIISDLKVFAAGYTRSRIGLFFSLVFPIILILLFGSIFSGGSNGPINVYVQNRDAGVSGFNAGSLFISELNNNRSTTVTIVDNSQNLTDYMQAHSAN